VDEVYQFITHRVIFRLISAPLNWFDRRCVDGFMDLTALATRLAGRLLRATVTGQLHTYFLWVVAGALALALVLWQAQSWVPLVMAGLALLAVAGLVAWQLVLVLTDKTEPLKRIDRD
jgi:hypothetical protein